jgi:hypothetical protein
MTNQAAHLGAELETPSLWSSPEIRGTSANVRDC